MVGGAKGRTVQNVELHFILLTTIFFKHSIFEVFMNVGRFYFGRLWRQKPYYLLQFVSVPSKDQQQLLILLNIYC